MSMKLANLSSKPQKIIFTKTKEVIDFFKGDIPDLEKGIEILKSRNIVCFNKLYLEALEIQEKANNE